MYVCMYVESQSNGMQKAEALRRVEFKKNVAPHVNIINYLGACSSGKKSMCLLPGGGRGGGVCIGTGQREMPFTGLLNSQL